MHRKKTRRLVVALAIVLVQAIVLFPVAQIGAYDSGSKWITSRTVNPQGQVIENVLFTRQYQVDPDLDYKLGLSGSPGTNLISRKSLEDAAGLWNKGSAFKLGEAGGWNPGAATLVSAQNFVQALPCFGVNPATEFGVTCYQDGAGAGMLGYARIYLNTYNTSYRCEMTGLPGQR
jgi:hypothetical protein